jgi:RNA recognition motif-containing protein
MWQIKDSKLVSKFNIIVKNLPKEMTSKELSELFSEDKKQNVFSAKIPVNSKQNSEGFGFVCFFDEESVNNSIAKWHNQTYKGKTLTVEQ